ncbi:prolyl 4-hydroxylase subunit alpha [Lacihabitans sp. LS3-19]|uniref:2OG-Fe(II) oxygenase n=1 Tax=Lacihabitans sp. LS3-19 TaxID=2487335 RepID=UPI0020CBA196|nr:2OG-Fe(II) oxygenase [Lacihabitans sp. LS3-19]MCP9769536.1 prolyl 4-hydroxylase subunit alpha [Lacihabitans sp. LS3-19]
MQTNEVKQKLEAINWSKIAEDMHEKGYAIIPEILASEHCKDLIEGYIHTNLYRKTVTMERYRFGLGEYKYFKYPLPSLIQIIRENVYPRLVPIANTWMKCLKIDTVYPENHEEFLNRCLEKNQNKATVLILKYGKGGHNTLHQDLYGDIFFPIQCVLFLNEPGKDYIGGEFVLTQQTPRAQSKAIVLNPKKGDMLIFTTNFRPIKGSKGYYRVNMKHGVSEIESGERHTLGIIFHDALS